MKGVDEAAVAGSKRALLDPATRKETTVDKTDGAAPDEIMKGAAKKVPTAEEIVEPTARNLQQKASRSSLP